MGHLNLSQWPYTVWHNFTKASYWRRFRNAIRNPNALYRSRPTHPPFFVEQLARQYTQRFKIICRSLGLNHLSESLNPAKKIIQAFFRTRMECTNKFLYIARNQIFYSLRFAFKVRQKKHNNIRRGRYKNNLFCGANDFFKYSFWLIFFFSKR